MKILTISDTHNQHEFIPLKYIDNTDGHIDVIQKESLVNVNNYADGALIYFYNSDEAIFLN